MTASNTLTTRWYLCLALGVVAFTLYGSYVPFHYVPMEWSEAQERYRQAIDSTILPSSKSDWLANWFLGVPLGFCLLGAMRVDRPERIATIALGVGLIPLCLTFAAMVEFGQLYFPGRTCSGADIWAQGLGSFCGVMAWVFAGQRITDTARRALNQLEGTGTLLLAYAFLVLVEQMLPFDMLTSPADWYRRPRNGTVTLIPLSELAAKPGVTASQDWKKVEAWCELLSMAIPGGMLVAGLSARWKTAAALPRVVLLGFLSGTALELAQWPVESRHPSVTDVVIFTLGIFAGWAIVLAVTDKYSRKYRVNLAIVFGQLWFGVMAVSNWQPFDFHPPLMEVKASKLTWLPFDQQLSKAYLWGLEEILQRIWMFVPLGIIAAWGWKRSSDRRAILYSVGVCVLASVVLEIGQLLLPTRIGSPTDVIFAAMGGVAGAFVTRRRLALAAQQKSFIPRSSAPSDNWWMTVITPPPASPDPPSRRVPL